MDSGKMYTKPRVQYQKSLHNQTEIVLDITDIIEPENTSKCLCAQKSTGSTHDTPDSLPNLF